MKQSPERTGALVGAIALLLVVQIKLFAGGTGDHSWANWLLILLAAVVLGAVAGGIVGACFKGEDNRGAVVFAVLAGLGLAVDSAITMGEMGEGILAIASEVFPAGALGIFAGAIIGRLVVSVVRWTKRERGKAGYGPGVDAAYGAVVGAVSASVLTLILGVGILREMLITSAVIDHYSGTLGPNLFGFLPLAIAGGIAGAVTGLMTPRPPESEVRPAVLVKVWIVQSEPEAEIVKSLLDSRGIESVSEGQIILRSDPFSDDGLRQLDILVREEDAERARAIIEEHLEGAQ